MSTHPDINRFEEGRVKEALEYLWEFSQKNGWEIPIIVPYASFMEGGAAVQWGSKIILYVVIDYTWSPARLRIEVDYMGVVEGFYYPTQVSELIMFLLK